MRINFLELKVKSIKRTIIVVLFILVCLAILFFWLGPFRKTCNDTSSGQYTDQGCGNINLIDKTGYIVLENKINDYVNNQKSAGILYDVAIYFRDLKLGSILDIGGSENFTPASLLKLPLAFAYIHMAEASPGLLAQKLQYLQPSSTIKQQITTPGTSLVAGNSYSIEELIIQMLKYSDNESYQILTNYINYLDPKALVGTFEDLGIVDPANELEQTMSVRDYSSLFRILYTHAYLNSEDSNRILLWLTEATFKNGIAGGVPNGIKVANKFGEREVRVGNVIAPVKQLHDCGIVYYPGNPYILCVMTRGSDINKLSDIIASISKMVYDEFNSRRIE